MRILHYQRDMRLKGGGVVRFVLDVAAAVAARGHEVVLASPDVSDLPAEWKVGASGLPRALKLPVPDLPMDLWGPGALREVRGAMAASGVVHIHGVWWPTNVQIARAADALGVPYVITPHGMFDDVAVAQKSRKKKLFHALVGRRLFERAALVHVTAQGELNQTHKWFHAPRTAIVPPVIDLHLFRDLRGPEEARAAFTLPLASAPVVLFLSRVHPQKCPEVLIDAVALLKERGVDCNLFIAGPGESGYIETLNRRAAERGVADRTRFPGMVSGPLKVSLYQMATVFALPSPQESFGLVMTEAMSCGTPVVTTDSIDISPELRASTAAETVPGTAEAFAGALGGLLAEPDRRSRLAAAARAWLKDYLDPAAVAVQYEAMYADICKR